MRVVVQRPGLFYPAEGRDPEAIMLGPLRAAAGSLGVELVEVSTPEQALAVVAGADAFVGGADLVKVIQHAGPSLRWVHVQSAGVESYPHEVIEKAGVTLTNSAVIYGPQLADHVMALILAFSRQLPFLFQAQQEQRWASRSEYPPGELAGQTLLVIGLGGAGGETATRAGCGFGMRVIGTKRTPPTSPPPGVERVLGSSRAELHSVLPEADWIAVCCGLNSATVGLFGAQEFSLMKRTAVIVTVARGRVIQTEALVQALNSGTIGGAGLDVTDPEPLPPGHALWNTPNTIITPHASGHSPVADERWGELVADNLRLFSAGKPLRNVVDLQADRLEAKL